MKKLSIFFAATILASAASCSKIDIQEGLMEPQRELTPLAIFSGDKVVAKTSLNGSAVYWTADDVVAVFDKGNFKNEFKAVSVDGSKARFEGLVEAGTTEFYAVYPYQRAVSADNSNLYLQIPADQTPEEGTFAEELNLSVAKGVRTPGQDEVAGLKFRNVCGVLHFTVPERLAAVSNVKFVASNRMLSGDVTVSKSDAPAITKVTSGSNYVSMSGSFQAGSTFYFVVAPGDIAGFSVEVTTANGATFSKTSTKTISVDAGAFRNLGTIDFKSEPSAVAEHTYENGVLTGTRIALNLGMPDKMGEYVTDLNATLVDADKRQYRAISSKSNVSGVVNMAVRNGAIYVPKGDYTLTYSYKMNGVLEEKTLNVTVPAPEFTVSAFAETSYSRYINNDATANTYFSTPYEVKNIAYSVSISDEVLEQFGLSECSGAVTAVSGGEKYASTDESASVNMNKSAFYSNPGVTNVPIGEYSVSASATFDGVSKSSPTSTIYITGLPYKAPTMVESDWEYTYPAVCSNGKIVLGDSNGLGGGTVVLKRQFYIPENINIKVSLYAYLRNKLAMNSEFMFFVNNNKVISKWCGSVDNYITLDAESIFTPSGSSIKMEGSYKVAGSITCDVYSLNILYNL